MLVLSAAAVAVATLSACGGRAPSASPRPVVYTNPANGFQIRYAAPFSQVKLERKWVDQWRKWPGADGWRPRLALQLPDDAVFLYADGPRTVRGRSWGWIEDNLDTVQPILSHEISSGKAPPWIESCTMASLDGFRGIAVQGHHRFGGVQYRMQVSFVFGPTGTITVVMAAPVAQWEADRLRLQSVVDSFDVGAWGSG